MIDHANTEFFISKFSHELRNPLSTLYSTIQIIEQTHPEVRQFKYWSTLLPDIEYMNLLLDELSGFSKVQHLNPEEIELTVFLKYILLSFAASIANSKVELSSKIDIHNLKINGDKTKLQEVFLNLLKNAYEASLPDQKIFFSAFQEGKKAVFLIRDTGCGILPEQLPNIFDPFVTYKDGGTGLGLCICREIIMAHNGSITVTSKVGHGTTFRVELPAA